jgi:CheY-specific phosphatase CheX
MKVTAQQLNQVATLLGTKDKNIVISAIITTLVEAGMSIDMAYDAVFGAGSYKKIAGDIWEAINAA